MSQKIKPCTSYMQTHKTFHLNQLNKKVNLFRPVSFVLARNYQSSIRATIEPKIDPKATRRCRNRSEKGKKKKWIKRTGTLSAGSGRLGSDEAAKSS